MFLNERITRYIPVKPSLARRAGTRVANSAANTAANRWLLAPMAALALIAFPAAARADFSLKVEPGVAIPLSAPQSEIYGVGGSLTVKPLFSLTPYLDVGPSVSYTFLPASAADANTGVAWGLGGGLRLKRPFDRESFAGISPWMDADVLYVRTGPLNRIGFDAALGLAVPIGQSRTYWAGPFVRYFQTVQTSRAGFDSRDARILVAGISLEVGPGVPKTAADKPPVPKKTTAANPDRDGDGVANDRDACPDVAGPAENDGCPVFQKIIVRKDKLELKEKLYFAWDRATIEEESYPALDEVVQALKDNKGFKVQVQGHTDSSGPDAHNQTLSEERAKAVLNYLADKGIAEERLNSKGFSSSVPVGTNTTVQGREDNRRVEFVVSFIILNPESAQ